MRFWDSSARVPLLLDEPASSVPRSLLREHAALVACDERPHVLPFVTLDDRLADAARREGFAVPPLL